MSTSRDLKDAGETSIVDKQTGQVFELDVESLSPLNSTSKNGQPQHTLKKGLNSRHIQLIALGGCIGTGLFVGTSSSLHKCGPAGLLTSYLIISMVIYPVMNALGEMVCFLPGTGSDMGGSVSRLVTRYVDPSLGFATGWNYYYAYVVLVASECTAASGVVTYWTTAVPSGGWIAIFLAVVTLLNFGAVKYYGESEFWFAIIKILCIVGLLMVSFILFWGGGPNHDRLGFRYWQHPGAFAYHITTGNTGRFLDVWTGVIKGGFAFILGPELVALTSAEAVDSRRNIAKASKRFVYRLIFFYITSALAIGVIVAYNDKVLSTALDQGKSGAASSPFVIGIQNAGIKGLPHIINACILSSAWSSGNSFLFAASRSLLAMAEEGTAPRFFAKINRFGVPYNAVGISALLSCIAFLNVSAGAANGFNWLSNISTISGFIGWICIGVAYLRFRKAVFFRGLYERVPFKTPFQPYGTYFFLVVVSIICLTNGYVSFIPKYWKTADFVAAYITLPVFLALWLGHKIYTRTWTTWMYPVAEIDVTTGLAEIEEETKELDAKRVPPEGAWNKFLEWLL
ncbi:LAME_0H07250g1_1 [Lachancea meyersii CBS 8951]|uniref:LAME_0H07250g1_1 n=1 Tax=Lachancea meyersii CBS 8951 TaxID=1266667 RepID=A0A1G4KEY8_9SACH|nr:LAME_0H07250g1_1 [Lachancea meyersii CBS 8951]